MADTVCGLFELTISCEEGLAEFGDDPAAATNRSGRRRTPTANRLGAWFGREVQTFAVRLRNSALQEGERCDGMLSDRGLQLPRREQDDHHSVEEEGEAFEAGGDAIQPEEIQIAGEVVVGQTEDAYFQFSSESGSTLRPCT